MTTTNTWHHDFSNVVQHTFPSTSTPPSTSNHLHPSVLNTSSSTSPPLNSSPWSSSNHLSTTQQHQQTQDFVLSDLLRLSISDNNHQNSSTDLVPSYDLATHFSTHLSSTSPPPYLSTQNHQLLPTRVLQSNTPLLDTINDPTSLSTSHSADQLSLTQNLIDSSNNRSSPRMKNEKYKTEICRSFADSGGFCKYGAKCQFAHGDNELRPIRRHPRYKTKLCRNFVTNGSCPYATRCRFIHASDLALIPQNTLTQAAQKQLHDLAIRMPALFHDMTTDPAHTEELRHLLSYNSSQNYNNSTIDTTHHPQSLLFPSIIGATDLVADDTSPDWSHSFLPTKSSSADMVGDQATSQTPTDQVYHPNVNLFQDYSENRISQPYLSLPGSGIGRNTAFSSSPFSANDIFNTSNTNQSSVNAFVGTENVGSTNYAATDENSLRQTSRFTHHVSPLSLSNKTTDLNDLHSSSAHLKSDRVEDRGNPLVTPTRSRLPLFCRLTSEADSV